MELSSLRGVTEETGLEIIGTRRRRVYGGTGAVTKWTDTCDLGGEASNNDSQSW